MGYGDQEVLSAILAVFGGGSHCSFGGVWWRFSLPVW